MTVSSFQTKDATGCFTIFGIPFAAMGVLMAGKALSLTTGNTPDWAQVGMHALAALAGCVVGFGLIALGIYGGKKQRAIESLRAAAPDQPWMWREDWARGVIQSNTSSTMKSAWFLAVFWNSVSFPSAYLALRAWNTGSVKDNKILAVALFPIVGVGLLIWAARETLRRIEFGKTFFTMSAVPAAVGGRLRGTIQTRFPRGAA